MKELLEVSELIKDLFWVSEIDEPWKVEIWDNLDQVKFNDFKTVDFDQFFDKATQSQSWYGDKENTELEQYQSLVEWLKVNLADLRVYKVGEISVDIYVAGRLDNQWLILKTKVVET